jgi:hypothetical protein
MDEALLAAPLVYDVYALSGDNVGKTAVLRKVKCAVGVGVAVGAGVAVGRGLDEP